MKSLKIFFTNHRSFFEGMGRLSIYPEFSAEETLRRAGVHKTPFEAIASDWAATGQDIHSAVQFFEKENLTESSLCE